MQRQRSRICQFIAVKAEALGILPFGGDGTEIASFGSAVIGYK